MIVSRRLLVREDEAGMRLDAFLAGRFPSSTRAFCREAIASGGATVGGGRATKGRKTRAGEEVVVHALREAGDNRVAPDPSVRPAVVYDDGVLIGVDKPAGVPVQPLSCAEKGTLMNWLVAYAPELASAGDDPLMAGALHRIDAGTSGLVLASRSRALFDAMRGLFAAREVEKTYLALVRGRVRSGGTVSCDLVHDPSSRTCRMIDAAMAPGAPRPMRAETAFRPLRAIGPDTLLEVTIRTGVTHQIRAQLAMAGCPVKGDAVYGDASDARLRAGRRPSHCLHALAVSFVHPSTGARTRIETPPPQWARP